ncbi:MAG: acetamidase [Solirubrobacterales bacterium]|jgi:acetamidase/formamidase|nr:acetamidase [Solirubrobacterales bacterium]
MAEHTIGRDAPTHTTWDACNEPVGRIASGDVVHLATQDFSGGQIRRDSTHQDVPALDFGAIYPLAGPIFVEGAEPGDALAVEVVELRPADWGYAFLSPGLGLLPRDEFPEPYLKVFDLTAGAGGATRLTNGVEIPIEPFLGTMGVCPAGGRDVPIPPPHRGGGNIDLRHVTAGSTLLLPVLEPGALFSAGDAHAAQGDGEVAISGLECDMEFSLRFTLRKGLTIPGPQLRRPPGSLTPRVDGDGWYGTFGVEPDLMEGARQAVRAMIDHLGRERGLSREDAYLLCSLAGDLKITEVVDAPQWIVGCFVPDAVFVAG